MFYQLPVTSGDVIYDIETYPNCFTLIAKHVTAGDMWFFECSTRKNQLKELRDWLIELGMNQCRMVGFNNIHFDYPVIHMIYNNFFAGVSYKEIYDYAMSIIKSNNRFSHVVWDSDHIVPQIDLFKIHHFDNKARATSLKVLEFNMRMSNIEDLPFAVGTELSSTQIDTLIEYNKHDVEATLKFYNHSLEHIQFREELTKKYNKNFMNHNDTKIGKDYFIMELEKTNPGCCYDRSSGKRVIRQTAREEIDIGSIILPYVNFTHPEFIRIHDWFKHQKIEDTKGVFTDITANINGFNFDFGTGGIHGSVPPQIVEADDNYQIIDVDAASYYPNLAISNGLYPEHLGQTFCDIYKDVYEQRKSYAKGTAENAMLKLALNGVYGDSNNQYSPFYDPQYTMSITINGQLLLCLLAETLLKDSCIQMVQINTDGLTVKIHNDSVPFLKQVCQWWEQLTGLVLEDANYSRMFIRDVNNYIAEYTDGSLKRKGAYEYEIGWHQNHSALVVKKAAEAALVHGGSVEEFINNHEDMLDFCLRTKVPRSSKLEMCGRQLPNIVRYYISTHGQQLEKVMPPAGVPGAYKKKNGMTNDYYEGILNEHKANGWDGDMLTLPHDERIHTKNGSRYEERRTMLHTGWLVELCNDITKSHFTNINKEWYIKEAYKLVNLNE